LVPSGWKEIVEGCDCGTCVNPHDIDAIADAIKFYVEHPDVAKMQGQNGRRAVEQTYNWGMQEKVLYEVYDHVLST
jgi:glycosyltransferase involved in cell wall biosynthesis